MKKLFIAFLAFITSAHLLAPVFEIENEEDNEVLRVYIYNGILTREQLAGVPFTIATIDPQQRAMLSIPDIPNSPGSTLHYGFRSSALQIYHIPDTRPTEQLSINFFGINRNTKIPGQAASPSSIDPALLNDDTLEQEFDELFQKQYHSVEPAPLTPTEENRLDALKAERARRIEIPKRMEELSEKYYTIGLTPEEKAEVRNARPLVPRRVSAQFYSDVNSGTNEFARATEDFILTKAPLQNLTDLQLIKARLHYRKLHDQARLSRDPRNTDPENRAYQISEEMGRRMNKDPKKAAEIAKKFNDIELKLMGLVEESFATLTEEQKKQILMQLRKNLVNFKNTYLLTDTLEKNIREQIKKQGFKSYYEQHLAKSSQDRKSFAQEFEKLMNVTLAGDEKSWFDAQRVIWTPLIYFFDPVFYSFMPAWVKETAIVEAIDPALEYIDKAIKTLPCDFPHAKKEKLNDYHDLWIEYIEDLFEHDLSLTSKEERAYGFKLLTLFTTTINDAFTRVLQPKSPDEALKVIAEDKKS